jgi:hypothetical protein
MAAVWHGAGESKSFEWLRARRVFERELDRAGQISVIPEIETPDMRPARTLRAGLFVAPATAASMRCRKNRRTSMTIPPRNPGAKPVTRALIAALEESAPGADVPNLLRIVDNLIGKAIDGDLSAIKEIFDRIDGKAPTAAAGAGTEEPTTVVFEWKSNE